MRARRHPAQVLRKMLLHLLQGAWHSLVAFLALTGLAAVALLAWSVAEKRWRPDEPKEPLLRAAEVLEEASLRIGPPSPQKQVIYLNREGGVILPGDDDASRNVSSVVDRAGLERFEVPAFRSTPQRWDAIVGCVEEQFEPYDVEVVDQRPVSGPYVMVMVGGRPGALEQGRELMRGRHLAGLAPMASEPRHEGIVFVFSRQLREQTRSVCETAAQEVGHAFGLDHVMDCRDPMTYLPRCGSRSFQDRDRACGEQSPRPCFDGTPTQNSHQHLLEVLGPRASS